MKLTSNPRRQAQTSLPAVCQLLGLGSGWGWPAGGWADINRFKPTSICIQSSPLPKLADMHAGFFSSSSFLVVSSLCFPLLC